MKIKFVLSMLFIAATLVAAIWQKGLPSSPPPPIVFAVETKDGKTIEITNPKLDPTFGFCESILANCESIAEVTVYAKRGNFELRKDFQEVERIDVLDVTKSHTLLKVTFQDGDVLEGKREYYNSKYEENWNPLDYIRGKSGKLDVGICLNTIASITRKDGGR